MLINFGTNFPLQRDSIAKIIFGLARNTGRYRKSVAYIADDNKPFEFEGVPAYPFKENRALNRVANKWFRLGAFTWQDLVRRINAARPDILHFQNKQWLIEPVMKRLAYRPKLVVHYHLFGEIIIPKAADLCVVVSKSMVDYLQKTNLNDKPIKVLHNFVPDNIAGGIADTRPAPNEPVKILFGGGGGRHKGIYEAIEAVEGLQGDFVLFVAGRSTDGLPISDPRIRNLGLLSGEEYGRLLNSVDIVLAPSRMESFGLVAIEALARGKLLVHTGVDGLAEFADPECTIVVEPRDALSLRNGIARAIQLVRSDTDALRKMAEKGRRTASMFSVARAVSELEEMYDELFD